MAVAPLFPSPCLPTRVFFVINSPLVAISSLISLITSNTPNLLFLLTSLVILSYIFLACLPIAAMLLPALMAAFMAST